MLEDDAEATAFARQHVLPRPPTLTSTFGPALITGIKPQYTLSREVLGILEEERDYHEGVARLS